MDEIDLIILRKLFKNSRLTYRALAELTDMAVSTVHKRISNLIEDEVILGFIARPSIIALKSLLVTIFGTSNAKSFTEVSKELGQNENVISVAMASGKMMYISGFLRDISALRDHSVYVSKAAEMSEPTVGIIDVPYSTLPEPLTSIDFKIIKSLNRDSRKPVIDIADDIGLSSKTVKKRLDRMIENNLVELNIEWSDKAENNLTTGFHIHLNEGTDLYFTSNYLFEKYNQNVIACIAFSNIPNFIYMIVWTKNTQESYKIQEKLQTEGFRDVIPHLIISTEYYECWVDKLVRSK